MEIKLLEEIVSGKRKYFLDGKTKDLKQRISYLKTLRYNLLQYKNDFYNAFRADFNKPELEVASTELGMVLSEIDFLIKKGYKYLLPRKVKTGIINRKSKGYILKEAYGVVLVVSPWNYPLNLSLIPAISALFCGNCVLLKMSKRTKNVNRLIEKITAFLPKEVFSVIYDDGASDNLFDVKYDYIFFTGSNKTGKFVMEKASKFLTPVSLELGGKSPAIVNKDADIELAAKRIVWGKFLNAGQTCIAPDYVYIHESVKKEFVFSCIKWIKKFYFKKGSLSQDFPFVIDDSQVKRLNNLLEIDKILFKDLNFGRLMSPTVTEATFADPIMKEEIFGPILPIVTFKNIGEAISTLKTKDKPLALYYFGENKNTALKVVNDLSYGGACINNTIMHFPVKGFPFGGVGASGIGSYHEEYSIDTFTHEKPVLIQSKKEFTIKYPPYSTLKRVLIEFFLKIF